MICPYDWRCGKPYERHWDARLAAYVYVHDEAIYVPAMSVHPDRHHEMVSDWLARVHREEMDR